MTLPDHAGSGAPLPPAIRMQLENAGRGLLGIHKALLEAERLEYEDEHGRIEGPSEFFRLAMEHPAFAWVRPLLTLVVLIDEVLAADDTPPLSVVEDLLTRARGFLRANENGDTFERRYHELLQDNPSVVIAHGEAMRLMRNGSES